MRPRWEAIRSRTADPGQPAPDRPLPAPAGAGAGRDLLRGGPRDG